MNWGVLGPIFLILSGYVAAYLHGREKGETSAATEHQQREVAQELIDIMTDKAASDTDTQLFYEKVKEKSNEIRYNSADREQKNTELLNMVMERANSMKNKWEKK